MADEHSMHPGRALTGGTSTARTFDLHEKSLWEENRNEDNVAARTFTNMEEMSTLVKKDLWSSLEGASRIARAPPHHEGGANVQCAGKATR